MILLAEFRPNDSAYCVEKELPRSSVLKAAENGGLTVGKLTHVHDQKLKNDKTILLADYEFPWSDVCSLHQTKDSKGSVVYEFSVTVLVPSSVKRSGAIIAKPSKAKRSNTSNTSDSDSDMLPIAHFDSPSFKVVHESAINRGKAHAVVCSESSKLDLEQAQPLISLYNSQYQELIRKEKDLVRKQLNGAQQGVVAGPGTSSAVTVSAGPPSRAVEADLGMSTDDVLEMLYENSLLLKSPYLWLAPNGSSQEDPTAALMKGLQQNSSIAAAMLAIERHNNLTRKECDGDGDGDATTSNGGSGAVPKPSTTAAAAASSSSSAVQQPSTFSTSAAFLSVEHIKSKYLQTQADPAASNLQKRFYTDMLQQITEAALFEVAHKVSRRPFKRSCRAFDLFSAVMPDVPPEYRGMVKGFLMTDLPYMPGINRAARYLRNRGHLVFSSSTIAQDSEEARRILGTCAQTKSVMSDLRRVVRLQDKTALGGEFDRIKSSTAAAVPTVIKSEKPTARLTVGTECSAVDVASSELDDVAEVPQLRSKGGRFTKKAAETTSAKKVASTPKTAALELKPELVGSDDSGAVAMLCLVADYVCGGGFADTQAARRKAEAVRRGLHACWEDVASRRSALVASLAALKSAEPTEEEAPSTADPRLRDGVGNVLALPTTASKRRRNYHRLQETQAPLRDGLIYPDDYDELDVSVVAEEEMQDELQEDAIGPSGRARRKAKVAPESPLNELRVYSRSRRNREGKKRKAVAALKSAAGAVSKHLASRSTSKSSAAVSLHTAALGHRLLMAAGGASGGGSDIEGSYDGSGSDSASLMSMSSEGEQD